MNNIKSGLFIKKKRNDKNLTQKELAKILNCTDKAVSRWETGKGFPEVSFLIPLSDALGVSVNEIILGEEIMKEELIKKSDSIIIETIKTSNKKIKTANYIIFVLLIVIEAITFYGALMTAQPGDEMGVLLLIIGTVLICSFFAGFTSIKLLHKLVFIPATILLFIPFTLLYVPYDPEFTFGYSAFFAVSSLALILISTGIQKLSVKLFHSIKKEINS